MRLSPIMTFLKLSLALIKNIGKGYVIPVESGRTGSFEKYCGEASVLAMGPTRVILQIRLNGFERILQQIFRKTTGISCALDKRFH